VRPVDWELAGVGPGLLDLAAITSGSWDAAERDRIACAYHRALPLAIRPRRADLLDALKHCRLLIAVQWLGWSSDWSAPAEHAHDWLSDAIAIARELRPRPARAPSSRRLGEPQHHAVRR
jgi:thiamine kinase-like enzyme